MISETLSGKDIRYLKKADGNFFKLIKKLWESAENASNLSLIKENYGITNICNALTFDQPLAVRGATAVLLYLCLDYTMDFANDFFYESFFVAIEKTMNVSNYLWLARLLRLLQIKRDFGDFMFTKGVELRENKVWRRLYDISRNQTFSEEIKKETSRAAKEGLRIGATEGQYCIIPERTISKMQKEFIWKLTEADIAQLDNYRNPNVTGADDEDDTAAVTPSTFEPARSQSPYSDHFGTQRESQLKEQVMRTREDRLRMDAELARTSTQVRDLQAHVAALHRRLQLAEEAVAQKRPSSVDQTPLVQAVAALSAELRAFKDPPASGKGSSVGMEQTQKMIAELKQDLAVLVRDTLDDMQRAVADNILVASGISPPGLSTGADAGAGGAYAAQPSSAPAPPPPSPPSPPPLPSPSSPSSGGSTLVVTLPSNFPLSNTFGGYGVYAGRGPAKDTQLPPGWERKIDPHSGRVFYFERTSRRAQWNAPQ